MAFCSFCKVVSKKQLKSCVCGKTFYCSKECQAKDWKSHKPSCPPYVIRESPGKGRGLFATRKIKEGQVIIEEYPLLTLGGEWSLEQFGADCFPNIEEETKAEILQLHDPAENIKKLDSKTVEKMVNKNPGMILDKDGKTDKISKIFRIFTCNAVQLCGDSDVHSQTSERGLYDKISRINHSCVPNTTTSWVTGDLQRKQVRALMTIEKDQEILVSHQNMSEFLCSSREFRQQELLETYGFLCECSECSLEGEDLQESDRMRAEFWEKEEEIRQLVTCEGSNPVPRRDMKKAMKVAQRRVKLIQKLNLRNGVVGAMLNFYHFAVMARDMGVASENDPDIYKQEAWKYAKMFGDRYILLYNKSIYS